MLTKQIIAAIMIAHLVRVVLRYLRLIIGCYWNSSDWKSNPYPYSLTMYNYKTDLVSKLLGDKRNNKHQLN